MASPGYDASAYRGDESLEARLPAAAVVLRTVDTTTLPVEAFPAAAMKS